MLIAGATLALLQCAIETEGDKYNQGFGMRYKGANLGNGTVKFIVLMTSEALETRMQKQMSSFSKMHSLVLFSIRPC